MKLRFETRFRELNWFLRIVVVYNTWLVQTSNAILNSSPLGKSWSNKSSNYVYGLYHFLGCFSKIAWNLKSRNAWCITNQLFQINTHPPVHAWCLGKIGLASSFGSKVVSMACKMFSSHKISKNWRKYMDFLFETMLSCHGRHVSQDRYI